MISLPASISFIVIWFLTASCYCCLLVICFRSAGRCDAVGSGGQSLLDPCTLLAHALSISHIFGVLGCMRRHFRYLAVHTFRRVPMTLDFHGAVLLHRPEIQPVCVDTVLPTLYIISRHLSGLAFQVGIYAVETSLAKMSSLACRQVPGRTTRQSAQASYSLAVPVSQWPRDSQLPLSSSLALRSLARPCAFLPTSAPLLS